MAAASGEVNPPLSQHDDPGKVYADDPREGKKRKFRPFEAVRKFFKGGKKGVKSEKDGEGTGKSRSLQFIPQEESDDDGGFRKRRPMGGSRSMSEDSIFQPEVKETKMEAIRKTAISMESLNKNFQDELTSKLKKRSSLYSSDDEGLAQSPTPPITTADILMAGSLKPLPGTGKSTSRDSDIGIESSETEEDDPFRTDWRKSVASVSMRKPVQSLPDSAAMDLDLSAISKEASTLSNDAARHRISLKQSIPKRRPSGIRKNREQRASTTSPLAQVEEESPSKSDVQLSPVTPEPLSPSSPVTPVVPTPLSPKSSSPKTDLFPKLEEKIPEQKTPIVQSTTDVSKKVEKPTVPDVSKKPDEHKTVIAIGQDKSISSGPKEERPPLKSMSLDRRMNYNLSDFSKPVDKPADDIRQISKLSRQRPKSLHDSVTATESSENDSELAKKFNNMKRNSLKESENVNISTQKDTGFYIVGSLKSKDKDIPFGARRPEKTPQVTTFNEGISTKSTEASSTTTQAKNSSAKPELVKPVVSPTSNVTYVLKKEPLRSQTSLSGDKNDISPTKNNVAIETKEDQKDSQKEILKQTLSDSNKEPGKQIEIDSQGADNTKDRNSNYENVVLSFDSGSQNKIAETKEPLKQTEKVVTISANDKKDDPSLKGRSSGIYDNVVIGTRDTVNKLASPREEYRQKRQSRSRTLPEQPVSAEILSGKPASRKESLTQSFKFKEDSSKTETILEKSETKPIESKTRSLNASYTAESTEPAWMKMVKKRQEENKEKENDSGKDKSITKPAFTGARISSLSDSTKFTPKPVFTGGSTSEPSKDKPIPKLSEPAGFKPALRTSVKGASSSETQKDVIVTKPPLSGVSSINKVVKDIKNNDKKADIKTEEKKPVSAASLVKSFEQNSLKTTTGRNVSLDSPKGWKASSIKQIEIIEKKDTSKPEETSKILPGRTTTAKKTEERVPLRTVPEKCVENKPKVFDLIKNFQNPQVS